MKIGLDKSRFFSKGNVLFFLFSSPSVIYDFDNIIDLSGPRPYSDILSNLEFYFHRTRSHTDRYFG